jgi:hypothetical protein
MQELDQNIGLSENRPFFSQKIGKNSWNPCYNIDPCLT